MKPVIRTIGTAIFRTMVGFTVCLIMGAIAMAVSMAVEQYVELTEGNMLFAYVIATAVVCYTIGATVDEETRYKNWRVGKTAWLKVQLSKIKKKFW